jgi:hypothetical protein
VIHFHNSPVEGLILRPCEAVDQGFGLVRHLRTDSRVALLLCGLKPHRELCGKSMGNIANYSFRTKNSRGDHLTGRQGKVTVLLLLVINHAGVVVCQEEVAQKISGVNESASHLQTSAAECFSILEILLDKSRRD